MKNLIDIILIKQLKIVKMNIEKVIRILIEKSQISIINLVGNIILKMMYLKPMKII